MSGGRKPDSVLPPPVGAISSVEPAERLHHRPLVGVRLPAARGEPCLGVGGRAVSGFLRGCGFAMAAGNVRDRGFVR